jgi:hypothetical protein
MGTVIQLQKLAGFELTSFDEDGDICPQPIEGWLDLKDCEEAALSVSVFERSPAASLGLLIQTATVAEGPWTTLVAFTGATVPLETKVFLTCKEGGTNRFERYVRWAADARFPGNWRICFKIDAVVR